MATQQFKPTSPGRRFMTGLTFDEITEKGAVKGLVSKWKRHGGRNNTGRITVRHRGGGAKRSIRNVSFTFHKVDVPGVVAGIAYDPGRSANLALIHYVDGEKAYILHAIGLKVGSQVIASPDAEISPGNGMPLRKIPVGSTIHNIELKVGRGGQLCRSAGAGTQLVAKDGDYAQIRLPSGEVRKVHLECWASLGQVSNTDHENITYGKAGRMRHRGHRSSVRGMAMNPVDHPHGGGEGRSKGGNHPCSPTGVPTKGYKTRKAKSSDRLIVKKRKKNRKS